MYCSRKQMRRASCCHLQMAHTASGSWADRAIADSAQKTWGTAEPHALARIPQELPNWIASDMAPNLMRLVQLLTLSLRQIGIRNVANSTIPSSSSATAFVRLLPDAEKVANQRADMALLRASGMLPNGAGDHEAKVDTWRKWFDEQARAAP